ncbi:hypothetical protein ScPMuIL_013497 [Solemya velum]
MPSISLAHPVYFQFRVCESGFGICSFPTANVTLAREGQEAIFARGQKYRIILEIDMPESPTNRDLGMFMVRISLYNQSGKITAESARPAVLRYKSELLHVIDTFVLSPYLLFGFSEQKQTLNVELFTEYLDDAYSPAVGAIIEVENMRIQFYTASIKIYADLAGLRYVLFYWPMLSAMLGVSLNVLFLSFLGLLSWYHFFLDRKTAAPEVFQVDFQPKLPLEQRRRNIRNLLEREKQDMIDGEQLQLFEGQTNPAPGLNPGTETLGAEINTEPICIEQVDLDDDESLLLKNQRLRSTSLSGLRLRHSSLQDSPIDTHAHIS